MTQPNLINVSRSFVVSEIFGPTMQGEGPVAGRQTIFIRLQFCDSNCSWCDSRYTWDKSYPDYDKTFRMTAEGIVNKVNEMFSAAGYPDGATKTVTLTGGNPLVQATDGELIEALTERGVYVQVETQGTILPTDALWFNNLVSFVVSPKPPSAKTNTVSDELLLEWMSHLDVAVKIVVFDDEDFEYAKRVYGLAKDNGTEVYLQAGTPVNDDPIEGLTRSYKWLVEKWLKSGQMLEAIVLPQLHVLVWGRQKGV